MLHLVCTLTVCSLYVRWRGRVFPFVPLCFTFAGFLLVSCVCGASASHSHLFYKHCCEFLVYNGIVNLLLVSAHCPCSCVVNNVGVAGVFPLSDRFYHQLSKCLLDGLLCKDMFVIRLLVTPSFPKLADLAVFGISFIFCVPHAADLLLLL